MPYRQGYLVALKASVPGERLFRTDHSAGGPRVWTRSPTATTWATGSREAAHNDEVGPEGTRRSVLVAFGFCVLLASLVKLYGVMPRGAILRLRFTGCARA